MEAGPEVSASTTRAGWCGLQWADTRTNTSGSRLQATYDMKSHNITSPNKFVWIQNNLRTGCKGEKSPERKEGGLVGPTFFYYSLFRGNISLVGNSGGFVVLTFVTIV
ncbi:hypothetical protein Pmani_000840 [Petrolisthes manimaculis]|uniref:Uncharacterized protein n=1 Tax=Petrolisthes manimaculis TaxID=1843537 RepID=A0AAE1QLQ8_9EUCA|nr:hypothetical protein Pmani_000840 [Petrolisthes manimaculis]